MAEYTYTNDHGADLLLHELQEHLGFPGVIDGLRGRGSKPTLDRSSEIIDFDIITTRDLTVGEKKQLDTKVASFVPNPTYTHDQLTAYVAHLVDKIPTNAEVDAINNVAGVKLALKRQSKIIRRLVRILVNLEKLEDPI